MSPPDRLRETLKLAYANNRVVPAAPAARTLDDVVVQFRKRGKA